MKSNPDLIPFLDTLADSASEAIAGHFRQNTAVENKSEDGFDPVTLADRDAEAAMRSLIRAHYPDHGVLGEEFQDENTDAENVWVLDPIDGTRAFIAGIPVWGTLIGLYVQGRASLGMMSQPFIGERFYGNCGTAWYRGPQGDGPLETRSCPDLSSATLMTTTPALFSAREREAYDVIEATARLTRYGLDCYGYCMIAAGFADIVIESGLAPYDIAALIPVIEGAGGVVSTWDGERPENGGRIVACGDRRVHDEALAVLSQVP